MVRKSVRQQPVQRRVIPALWQLGVDPSRYEWTVLWDGVEICPLYGEFEREASAALYRFQGGGRVPRHRHTSWEHTLILQGSQSDEAAEYVAGTLVVNGPGSEHTVISSDGCIALVTWTGPVTPLPGLAGEGL